jgi:TonB family protein
VVRLGIVMDAGKAPDHGIAILRVRLPYVKIQTPVSVRHIPTQVYPRAARPGGVEDAVALQHVVDEDGRVRRGTIRVLDATYQEFADAAADAIAAADFNPARVGACPVKAVVQQLIRFTVR